MGLHPCGATNELSPHVLPSLDSVQEPRRGGLGSSCARRWWELCICIPVQDSGIDIGDITARKALRKQLQCKTFRWYLVSVYPEMRMYSDIIAYGVVRSGPLGLHADTERRARQRSGVGGKDRSLQPHAGPLGDQRTRGSRPCGTPGRPVDQTQL